eukprot:TRINITY_DN5382_c2_g3_i4.p1 TRINITY_DN5382_c2_g3~~TRINITY_DN5382_c2_g3_i4.p1  ORF type:complete len:427 (+),score=59.32 TRINITY_DN5382_c2_g3_i4:1-1281(+)
MFVSLRCVISVKIPDGSKKVKTITFASRRYYSGKVSVWSLSPAEIKAELEKRGVKPTGSLSEQRQRLKEIFENESTSNKDKSEPLPILKVNEKTKPQPKIVPSPPPPPPLDSYVFKKSVYPWIDNPLYHGSFVNDTANIFNIDQIQTMNELCGSFKKSNAVNLVVVTVNDHSNINKGGPYQLDERGIAEHMFNSWGYDKSDTVLFYLSIKQRKLEVLTSPSLTSTIDNNWVVNQLIDGVMIPYYKKLQFFSGTIDGIQFVIDAITGNNKNVAILNKSRVSNDSIIHLFKKDGFFIFFLILMALSFIFEYVTRVYCFKCFVFRDASKVPLNELRPGELTETKLQTVTYYYYKCPQCQNCKKYGEKNQQYRTCSGCKLWTAKKTSSSFSGYDTYTCISCRHTWREKRSKSSSGSSSSGGSVGGGGGRW